MCRHLLALLFLLSLLLATQAGYGRVRGSGRRQPYRHGGGYGYGTRGHGYGRSRIDRHNAGGYGEPLGAAGYGAGGYGRPPPTQTPPCNAPCHPSYEVPGAQRCTCPGPEPETTPTPRPETTTAPPTANNDITIAFFAAKSSGGADFRRKRDGANASLPDDAILMNGLVDAWSDSLSAGKLTITFIPYADTPASPVTTTTVKDSKDFISNTYAALPALPAGKDPSQEAVVKAYQSRATTARARKPTKYELMLINTPAAGNYYRSPQRQIDDMAATGKVLKDISTQPNQLATAVAGTNTTAEDMEFYGDIGPSVSTFPEATMHLQEIANMLTCAICTLGDITLTPGAVTPTGTGPAIGADKCADLTVTCANPGGTVFMQFNVGQGGPLEATGETVTAMLDCVNGKWVYAPAGEVSSVVTEVNCVST